MLHATSLRLYFRNGEMDYSCTEWLEKLIHPEENFNYALSQK